MNNDKHKFMHNSEMTYQEVFDYAFRWLYIPMMQNLTMQLEEDNLITMLKEAASQMRIQGGQKKACEATNTDLATYTDWARKHDHFWEQTLTWEIIEDTETAFGLKITECLWAKTFREAGCAAIGYASLCHGDFAECQAFNPRIKLIRTKTLMEGDDLCNFRWVMENE